MTRKIDDIKKKAINAYRDRYFNVHLDVLTIESSLSLIRNIISYAY